MSRTFAASPVPSTIASTSNPMASAILTEPRLNCKINHRQREKRAEELAEWIRENKYIIPVRIPYAGEIVRIQHGGPALRLARSTVEDNVTGDVYQVSPDVIWKTRAKYAELYGSRFFALTISSVGAMFLWPVDCDDQEDAINEKENRWVRVTFNGSSKPCLLDTVQGDFSDPIWPDLEPGEILDMGFHLRVISSLDHPIIKKLHEGFDGLPTPTSTAS